MTWPTFRPVADSALLVGLGDTVDERTSLTILQLDRAITAAELDGVQETVPALVNLLVVFDPLVTDHATLERAIRSLPVSRKDDALPTARHVIDVCYDPEFGPDQQEVAAVTGLSVEDVIAIHTKTEFRVAMYGFAPGYAYLTGLPAPLRVPRKPAAVPDIQKGSVLVAGAQCLVTTLTMPTGWSVIGRSGVDIMREGRDTSFLFDVGDKVLFRRIRREELPEERQSP